MIYTSLISALEKAVNKAQENSIERSLLFENKELTRKHEFLLFIKPEITLKSSAINFSDILELILNKTEAFNLGIKNALLLPAEYLKAHDIIAQHYGVINAIARDAKKNLTKKAKKRFEEIFECEFALSPVYGGLEFLGKFSDITPSSLDYLWQNSPAVKLGGGAYAQRLKIDGEDVFLVNGFHPRQLEHFISPGRSIIAFTLAGDLDWPAARNKFIGKTNPADAEAGSIRRSLLEHKDRFGLQAVNSSWNGVHLSAGPVEGLVELIRYNSDFSSGEKLNYTGFEFGRQLSEVFDDKVIGKILNNATVEFEGKPETVFDITEEKNADNALQILKEVYDTTL